MIDTGDIDVFLGLDVGKGEHHATAVTPAGKKAFDKCLPNTEPKLRELLAKLQAKHGTVLVVVDQSASIGALQLAVARDMGCPVAYGAVRPIMRLSPGRIVVPCMGRGDLSDAEWERLRPFLPVSNGRCGRWRDHRQVIDGILHRVRTGVQWRDLPERFGPWKTVYERHRLWSADGTWERLLQQVQAAADAAGEIDWDISVDFTIVRAHQHAAGARTDPPPAPVSKGADEVEHQDETPWQSLVARLVEVVREARVWAARAAASPASST